MHTETAPKVAATILTQLGGAGRLSVMIGARDFLDCGDGLAFRFAARAFRSINRLKVTLCPDDTYAITFYKGRIADTVCETSGIYADGLREAIEHYTGLALSL